MSARSTVTAIACLSVGLLAAARIASAQPFADVAADHWAYDDLRSLAADGIVRGYPDGYFRGDRPLTRYEMAAIVARTIDRLRTESHGDIAKLASKTDLDKLQQLVFALKDELDGLGERVDALESDVAAVDERTKVAQALAVHGTMFANGTSRVRGTIPQTIANGTGSDQSLSYGIVAAPGRTAIADPFATAFLASDATNLPYAENDPGVRLQQDDRLVFSYAVSDNLTVSLPVHVVNFLYGDAYASQQRVLVQPALDLDVAQSGAFSNLHITFGYLDRIPSSRTGLAFRAPYGDDSGDPYAPPFQTPLQPTQRGMSIAGTVFGLTDFSVSFSRVDQVLLDTQPLLDVAGSGLAYSYLSPVIAPQAGLTQSGPAAGSAIATDPFVAASSPLAQVFLTQKAVLGTVYVSSYDGSIFDASGRLVAGAPGGPTSPPAFVYNDAYNAVVFTSPLPPGSHVALTYSGAGTTANTNFQRYMINARIDQKIKGLPGAAIGLEFNRLFDYDGLVASGDLTTAFAAPAIGNGAVSDTVFGIDGQVPLGRGDVARTPMLYAEVASSRFTPDYRTVAPANDGAIVVGTRARIRSTTLDVRYQSVGTNFLDGAPYAYYGNAPATFAGYSGAYFPGFIGLGNTLAINRQFDAQFAGTSVRTNVTGNPNLTYAYPVFNPLEGSGPTFYSAYVPNSRGVRATASTPVRIGSTIVETRLGYGHLEDIAPQTIGTSLGNTVVPTTVHLRDDTYGLDTKVQVGAFGKKIAVRAGGSYERLQRPDTTAITYYPYNPATGGNDAAAVAAATAAFGPGGGQVTYAPNYIDMKHVTVGAGATVPVTHDLGVSLDYTTQHFTGAYGTTIAPNIDQRKEFLTGTLTYHIPKTNSTIDVRTSREKFTDANTPTYNFDQSRQDIDFTIRF